MEFEKQYTNELDTHDLLKRAILRIATGGSITKFGGTVRAKVGNEIIKLESGIWVSIACCGDLIFYPDGTTAKITTACCEMKVYGRRVAVVGSRADNGDEIVSTPQCNVYFISDNS